MNNVSLIRMNPTSSITSDPSLIQLKVTAQLDCIKWKEVSLVLGSHKNYSKTEIICERISLFHEMWEEIYCTTLLDIRTAAVRKNAATNFPGKHDWITPICMLISSVDARQFAQRFCFKHIQHANCDILFLTYWKGLALKNYTRLFKTVIVFSSQPQRAQYKDKYFGTLQ